MRAARGPRQPRSTPRRQEPFEREQPGRRVQVVEDQSGVVDLGVAPPRVGVDVAGELGAPAVCLDQLVAGLVERPDALVVAAPCAR